MFDTSELWGNVLKKLRENDEAVLIGACSDLRDIEFTNELINITAHNDTVYGILKKYIDVLNKYAGGQYIQVMPPKKKGNKQTIEKLRELFGDKLKVEVK